MDLSEIELITDGDGLALVGPPSTVNQFLSPPPRPESRELELLRLGKAFGGSSAAFQGKFCIDATADALESRRWSTAVADTRDDLLRAYGEGVDMAFRLGAEGVEAAGRVCVESLDKAKEIAGALAGLAGRTFRRRSSYARPLNRPTNGEDPLQSARSTTNRDASTRTPP